MKLIPSWVIDTNVIVSAFLRTRSYPSLLVDAVLTRKLRLVFNDAIEAEYREVLARPRLGISLFQRKAFFDILPFQERYPLTSRFPLLPDAADTVFLEAAHFATDRVLVTGNIKHFPTDHIGNIRVLTPKEAWEILATKFF